MSHRIALIDGDELVYKIGHLSQESFKVLVNTETGDKWTFDCKQDLVEWLGNNKEDHWEVEPLVIPRPEGVVKYHLDRILFFVKERTKCKELKIFLTSDDDGNFRYKVGTIVPYKGNRDTSHRPYYYDYTRQLIMDQYNGVMETNCEADDGMSKAQYRYRKLGIDSCIVSQDKDLNMVPGDHFNIPKNKLYHVTPAEGIKFFYMQLLVGDSTDNIYGIYRVGMKTAEKWINHLNTTNEITLWNFVLNRYQEALDDPKKRAKMPNPDMPVRDRVIEVARLLWMQTHDQELWEPPTREFTKR